MKEHGLYIIKKSFLILITEMGGVCDMEKDNHRPVYCCIKDSKYEGLYWAIPTSDLSHRTEAQIEKYNKFIALPDNDLRSCYYHIGKTTKKALFKVSSCFPITEEYVDHEFVSQGVHVIIRRAETVTELERKLRKILAFESRRPNYFPQHITDIKNKLLNP